MLTVRFEHDEREWKNRMVCEYAYGFEAEIDLPDDGNEETGYDELLEDIKRQMAEEEVDEELHIVRTWYCVQHDDFDGYDDGSYIKTEAISRMKELHDEGKTGIILLDCDSADGMFEFCNKEWTYDEIFGE